MKLKFLLIAAMTLLASTAFAQESGLKGRVLSRNGRAAVGNVAVTIEGTTFKAQTNDEGYFELKGVPAGDYKLSFTAPEFENLDIVVKVDDSKYDVSTVKQKAYKRDRDIKQTANNTIKLTPGTHQISVQFNDSEIYNRKVFLSAGETKVIEL